MHATPDRNTDEDDAEHTLSVDPDDVIEGVARDDRITRERKSRFIVFHPPFEGDIRGKPEVHQEGNYYPPEMDPQPIKIRPSAFIDSEQDDLVEFPDHDEERFRFRDHYESSDEEPTQERWEEWWGTVLEVWEENARDSLVDMLRIKMPDEYDDTVYKVRYVEGDDE